MNVAIMSDIHANFDALTAVLTDVKESYVEKILCCGDFIGYYHRPAETLALLEEWDVSACSGNHDLTWREPERVKDLYGSGAAIAQLELSPKQKKWISNLPSELKLKIDGYNVGLFHGSPWDPDEYIYPDAPFATKAKAANSEYDIVFLGHTHYPFIELVEETWLANPGSVGQQRNGIPGAHWLLWETEQNKLTPRISKYDPSATATRARELDPSNTYLVDILYRGEV